MAGIVNRPSGFRTRYELDTVGWADGDAQTATGTFSGQNVVEIVARTDDRIDRAGFETTCAADAGSGVDPGELGWIRTRNLKLCRIDIQKAGQSGKGFRSPGFAAIDRRLGARHGRRIGFAACVAA